MLCKSCLKPNLQQLSHSMSVATIAILAITIDKLKIVIFVSFFPKVAKIAFFVTHLEQLSATLKV